MVYTYVYNKYDKENMARIVGLSLPISFKFSQEICKALQEKSLAKAKELLQEVIEQDKAIPYTRFTNGVGHRKGMAAGGYPFKASKHILELLESLEANAQFKGLNTAALYINHICAQLPAQQWHFGRQRRRRMKRTTIEITAAERKEAVKKEKEEGKKQAPKETKVKETKVEEKKEQSDIEGGKPEATVEKKKEEGKQEQPKAEVNVASSEPDKKGISP